MTALTANTALAQRTLGRTALRISELGFGAAPIGGFRGAVSEYDARGALQAAWNGGVRHFDTAPFYGYGRSELRVGTLLREHAGEAFTISTKVGRVTRPFDATRRAPAHRAGGLPFDADYDYGYAGTMRSVEQSMLRTGLTHFDILLIHDLDTFVHRDVGEFERHYADAMDGGMRALVELRAGGVVTAIGAGLNEAPTCARMIKDAEFDCVLLAGRYTLLDQSACDAVLPLCRARGISLIAGGPFNSGVLATDSLGGAASYHYAPAPADIVARFRTLLALAKEFGVSLPAAALQFALTCEQVSSVIPGARNEREQRAILDGFGAAIPDAFWGALVEQRHVRPDAPINADYARRRR